MPEVLAILAHCDDEVICGWPVLQDNSYDRHLLVIGMVGKGVNALRKICQNEGISLLEHSGYEGRFGEIEDQSKIESLIKITVDSIDPDFLFTHNSAGEYGHKDHVFLNNLVFNAYSGKLPIMTTDIEIRSEVWPKIITKETGEISEVCIDEGFWDRGKIEYEKTGSWTTNRYIILKHLKNRVLVFTNNKKRTMVKKLKIAWLCDVCNWAFDNQVTNLCKNLLNYDHIRIILKTNTNETEFNKRHFYTDEDYNEINNADFVVPMTPAAMRFLGKLSNSVVRLSGSRLL